MGKYVFGPVPSRRLGFSLGVDVIPAKRCTFDCIYCQIGKTTCLEMERRPYFDPGEVAREVIKGISEADRVDFVTFSGSGEPTLNSVLGPMIREVRGMTRVPVAVITNGSLLSDEAVRADLAEADVVLPSLDAASVKVFNRINRPHPLIGLDSIIAGLRAFRAVYAGQIWLEVMLMQGVNDDPEELARFKEIIDTLDVDKIQLNTVTRPPSEEVSGPVSMSALEEARGFFGDKCEIICSFGKSVPHERGIIDWEERVLEVLGRRAMNVEDIVRVTGAPLSKVKKRLRLLEGEGVVESYQFGGSLYYLKRPAKFP